MPKPTYRVLWSKVADRDLEEIVAYLSADTPAAAERVLVGIETKASSLQRNPDRGRFAPELVHFGMRAWRELVVAPYRIVYRVTGKDVIVLAVFDGRRELADVLLDRLLRD